MENFTTDELVLLNVAGPIFKLNFEVDSSTCNLQIEPWEGQVYKIDIKKSENYFDVDVLVNDEVLEKFDCLPFGELMGLVRSLDNQFFELFAESFDDEEDSEQTSEYLA
jgi:hypothetical protein